MVRTGSLDRGAKRRPPEALWRQCGGAREAGRGPVPADDALLQPGPRAQFQKLLRQGWRDALRALHPDAALYTYWSYLRNRWPRDAGLRIDHLLLSALAAKRLAAASVDREVRGEAGASDHAPVWVELKEAGGGRSSPRLAPSRKRAMATPREKEQR
jgi:hypothetical protein